VSEDGADPKVLADAAYGVIRRAQILERVIFVGFDWRALMHIREQAPEATCWFTTEKLSGDARPMIDMIAAAGAQGWFPDFRDATPDNVACARARGLKVGGWTVNRRDDMERLMGLDAICTDRPDLLQAFE
jgi:glycerophosphoryl diester phosphodiesterase